jgi:hypothetical protein
MITPARPLKSNLFVSDMFAASSIVALFSKAAVS